MSVPVNIYVLSDVSPFPGIPGVVVGVYDPITYAEVALATSDADGLAGFVLDLGTYEVRCQKLLTRLPNPSQFEVTDTGPNGFDISATILTESAPLDPYVCRCTGRLMSLTNSPIVEAAVQVIAKVDAGKQVPKVLAGNLVAGESFLKHTDADGFVSFDLPRGGEFNVMFAGEDDQIYPITVPDRPLANLTDLMFPYPLELVWNQDDAPGNAITVAVDERKDVRWTLVYSDFQDKGEGVGWLQFSNSDSTLAVVCAGEGLLGVLGTAPGSLSVTATTTKPEEATFRIPAPEIVVPPLSVTITP